MLFFKLGKVYLKNVFNKDVKYTIKYKKEYKLTPFQRQALIGIILGDGYLERAKLSYNTRLRIEQSYPEKEKYFNSLYSLLKPLVTMNPVILTRKPDKSPRALRARGPGQVKFINLFILEL